MAHKSQFVWSEALPSPAEHLIPNNLTDFPSDLLISQLFPAGVPTADHSFPGGLTPTKQHPFLFQIISSSALSLCSSFVSLLIPNPGSPSRVEVSASLRSVFSVPSSGPLMKVLKAQSILQASYFDSNLSMIAPSIIF